MEIGAKQVQAFLFLSSKVTTLLGEEATYHLKQN
jgi:hypothetical protein